ncbi:SDR family NAD(P)-dependent oxidoreductase [Enterococcus sp. CWB-B31]|uniref:SDR family NAD(P)-dependent oxidoreductase n=1 Tax=Enterococcus sp. CWB-B31 TaxID=2885159 RepID=UPI001E32F368|nr:SDR family oxidoreductase [Enterococcus sp. CWB-B31]MCB5953731.1 SDR family oxidoreductase [Enterococcus sp. CWB-B31]
MKKKILIFGGSGGIGSELVVKLTEKYDVIVFDKNKKKHLAYQRAGIKSFLVDLTEEASKKVVLDYAHQASELYGVIFASGLMIPGSVTELSKEEWLLTMNVNVNLVFEYTKLLLPYLTKHTHAHIIALASHLGVVGTYNMSAYSVSKAAVIELIKCMALDYGDQGVLVNAVSPGFVKTNMLSNAMNQLSKNKKWMFTTGGLPKQYIQNSDIAQAITFILNQTSMTGENIVIDGGYTAR